MDQAPPSQLIIGPVGPRRTIVPSARMIRGAGCPALTHWTSPVPGSAIRIAAVAKRPGSSAKASHARCRICGGSCPAIRPRVMEVFEPHGHDPRARPVAGDVADDGGRAAVGQRDPVPEVPGEHALRGPQHPGDGHPGRARLAAGSQLAADRVDHGPSCSRASRQPWPRRSRGPGHAARPRRRRRGRAAGRAGGHRSRTSWSPPSRPPQLPAQHGDRPEDVRRTAT